MTLFKAPFFSRGEISPRLYGRVDTAAYQSGLKTARNCIVGVGGGVMNRPGTIMIGPTKYHDKYTRLVPFSFKTNDSHMLEFGDRYIRIIREDFYQTELNPKSITNLYGGATFDLRLEVIGHGYSDDDEIIVSDVGGTVEINNGRYKVEVLDANNIKLYSVFTGEAINPAGTWSAYTGGGTVDRIYEIETEYVEADLPMLKWAQSADVLILTHVGYPPKALRRFGLANWTISDIEFFPSTEYPHNISLTVNTPGTDTVEYQVTAIDRETGIESLPGIPDIAYPITNATQTNPVEITTSIPHGLQEEDEILIGGLTGMTELNDRRFTAVNVGTDTLELLDEDGRGYSAFAGGPDAALVPTFYRMPNSASEPNNTLTWSSVPGASLYAVYRQVNGLFSYIGETPKTTFTDNNIEADTTDNPPIHNDPFRVIDSYPGAAGFYQQRLVFGGSNSKPATYWASQTGDFFNFSRHSPLRDDDAIEGTLVSGQQINQIKHFLPVKYLSVFTTGNEWAVSSGGEVAFSPYTVRQDPQTNWGVAEHRPMLVGQSILFVQEDNRTVRSFSYDLDVDGFKSTELSLLSDHIFDLHGVKDWAYCRAPYSAMFLTRTDGHAAVMVYNEEQNVIGWTRMDTRGTFETVGVVRVCVEHETPEPDDGVYFTVRRKLNGRNMQFVERLHSRRFKDVRDCFFVDCGRSYDSSIQITDIDLVDGQPIVITAPDHGLSNDEVVTFTDIVWEPTVDSMGNETQPDQLNDVQYVVSDVTTNTFKIKQLIVDGDYIQSDTTWKAYVRGGVARLNTNVMYNLDWLEGERVSILADSFPFTDVLVQNGRITLPGLASRIHVGLPYTCDIETLPFEPAQIGSKSIQGLQKKVSDITIRLDKSREAWFGPTSTNLVPMKRAPFTDISPALYTGDRYLKPPPDWNGYGSLFFRVREPLPFNLLAIFPDIK